MCSCEGDVPVTGASSNCTKHSSIDNLPTPEIFIFVTTQKSNLPQFLVHATCPSFNKTQGVTKGKMKQSGVSKKLVNSGGRDFKGHKNQNETLEIKQQEEK